MSAKKITGTIYKRGKEGRYYLRYKLKGVSYNVALKDDNGQPVTDERTAIKAKDAIINPLNAGTEAKRLENIISKLQTAEEVVDKAAQQAEAMERDRKNMGATIADGWKLFMTCKSRPKSCKRYTVDELEERVDGGRLRLRNTTVGNYKAYYEAFTEWMQVHHSDVMALANVTSEMAEAFMKHIGKDFSEGTYNKYLQFLKTFYKALQEDGVIIGENPFAKVERKDGVYYSKQELTAEQVANIIEHADGEMKALLCIGYFTGLRLGDCCTLLWREVDLDAGLIRRTPRKTEHHIKDKAVPQVRLGIPPYLARVFEDLPRTGKYVLPEMANMYLAGCKDRISRRITAIFQAAGINTHAETEEDRTVVAYGFHSLRYSYVSLNAESGVPQAVIQANAGHKSKAMTAHYEKISDEATREYANRLTLPSPKQETIEGEVISDDPDGDRLREVMKKLADALPIEKVQEIVNNYTKKENSNV
jgi:integrase